MKSIAAGPLRECARVLEELYSGSEKGVFWKRGFSEKVDFLEIF